MKTNQERRFLVEATVRLKWCFPAVLILILVMQLPMSATTVQRLSLDDLVSKAETIVIGHVVESKSSWTKDGKLILTQTTLQVQEGLKGTATKSIQVTTIGGQIGKTLLHVSGMPAFQPDETAVIFLEKSSGYLTVLGLNQGKFSIRNGEITNTLNGLTFSNGDQNVKPVRMPLEEFKHQIQQRLQR
jgi:hypothetical protein